MYIADKRKINKKVLIDKIKAIASKIFRAMSKCTHIRRESSIGYLNTTSKNVYNFHICNQ